MSTITRETLVTALVQALQPQTWVNAAWIGGSAAYGPPDRYADLDLQLDVDDARVDDTFALVERTLEALSPIEDRLIIPTPTWHGHAQRFYRLRDAGEYLLVDLVVMQRTTTAPRFDEREIHGELIVLFDKVSALVPPKLDQGAHREKIRQRIARIASRRMFQVLPKKEILRGHPIDAMYFFHGFTLAPLVDLLRIEHCPQRFDFAMRYLDRDLPKEVVERLQPLFFAADLEDLERKRVEAERWLEEQLAKMRAAYR